MAAAFSGGLEALRRSLGNPGGSLVSFPAATRRGRLESSQQVALYGTSLPWSCAGVVPLLRHWELTAGRQRGNPHPLRHREERFKGAARQSTPNPVLARSGATKQSPERFGPRPVLSLRGAKRRGNLWSALAPTRPPEIAASRPSGPFLAMTWWGGLSRRVLRAAPPNDRQRELGSRGEGVKPRVLFGVASLLWTLEEAWILDRDALARISHTLPAAAADAPASATFLPVAPLATCLQHASAAPWSKRHTDRPLHGLATKLGEICGLGPAPLVPTGRRGG